MNMKIKTLVKWIRYLFCGAPSNNLETIEKLEAQRVERIRRAIEEMRLSQNALTPDGMLFSSKVMLDRLAEIRAHVINAWFGEFAAEAQQVKDEAIKKLKENIAAAEKREQDDFICSDGTQRLCGVPQT